VQYFRPYTDEGGYILPFTESTPSPPRKSWLSFCMCYCLVLRPASLMKFSQSRPCQRESCTGRCKTYSRRRKSRYIVAYCTETVTDDINCRLQLLQAAVRSMFISFLAALFSSHTQPQVSKYICSWRQNGRKATTAPDGVHHCPKRQLSAAARTAMVSY